VIPSSTNPTIPYTLNTAAEHFDMILTVHGLNPAFPEDVQAAETPLHDLGAISITSSDSLGMRRIGETIQRTWQMAHVMEAHDTPKTGVTDSNKRVLRFLAKYTINPAITHGLIQHVGTLEPVKLADVVLWRPRSFGIKANLVIEGGMPAWGALGDGNATVEGAEPRVYGPLVGGRVGAQRLSRLHLSHRLRSMLDYKNV